jgi:hypothetical protein
MESYWCCKKNSIVNWIKNGEDFDPALTPCLKSECDVWRDGECFYIRLESKSPHENECNIKNNYSTDKIKSKAIIPHKYIDKTERVRHQSLSFESLQLPFNAVA